jgi:hypothetical protein
MSNVLPEPSDKANVLPEPSDKDSAPITTREYLVLGTIERKKRRRLEVRSWILVALVTLFTGSVTIGGLIWVQRVLSEQVAIGAQIHEFQAAEASYKVEQQAATANHKADQAVNKAAAVQRSDVLNTKQVCVGLTMLASHQARIITLLATADKVFVVSNEAVHLKRVAIEHGLLRDLKSLNLPSCVNSH